MKIVLKVQFLNQRGTCCTEQLIKFNLFCFSSRERHCVIFTSDCPSVRMAHVCTEGYFTF